VIYHFIFLKFVGFYSEKVISQQIRRLFKQKLQSCWTNFKNPSAFKARFSKQLGKLLKSSDVLSQNRKTAGQTLKTLRLFKQKLQHSWASFKNPSVF
jgi:hypothetical protein